MKRRFALLLSSNPHLFFVGSKEPFFIIIFSSVLSLSRVAFGLSSPLHKPVHSWVRKNALMPLSPRSSCDVRRARSEATSGMLLVIVLRGLQEEWIFTAAAAAAAAAAAVASLQPSPPQGPFQAQQYGSLGQSGRTSPPSLPPGYQRPRGSPQCGGR